MSDKSINLSKVAQKHAGRVKERFLQNLGKADKTRDEAFEEYLNEFSKRQQSLIRMQKELKNFMSCCRALKNARKSFMDSLIDNYDSECIGCEPIPANFETFEGMWDEFNQKVNDQLMIPLLMYQNRFNELCVKIAKRDRKLTDYDCCRHNLQSLQNSRKKDEARIEKAKEHLEETKHLYEAINNELLEELPAVINNRSSFLISCIRNFFLTQVRFYKETAKILSKIVDTIKLEEIRYLNGKCNFNDISSSNGAFNKLKYNSLFSLNDTSLSKHNLSYRRASTPVKSQSVCQKEEPKFKETENGILFKNKSLENLYNNITPIKYKAEKEYECVEIKSEQNSDDKSDCGKIPISARINNLPSGILYKVEAVYRYIAEDLDELSFECGEIIRVIEHDDSYEHAEGWLCGIKESSGEKGLFPENFTKPI